VFSSCTNCVREMSNSRYANNSLLIRYTAPNYSAALKIIRIIIYVLQYEDALSMKWKYFFLVQ